MATMFDMLLAQRGLGDGRVMPISGVPTAPMTVGGGPIAPRPSMAPMSSGVPEDPIAKARSLLRDTVAGARQGVDPRIEAILARREERLAKQEGGIRENPSLAETLVRIGNAMAQTRSPNFSAALTEGLNANMQANLAQRAEAMRQRQAIAESRDEIGMERIRQEGAGRKEAMDELNVVLNLAKNIGGIEGDALKSQAERIAIENAPAEAAARLRTLRANATTAEVNARYAPRTAEADIAAKIAAAASSRRGGSGSDVEARQDRSELDNAAADYNAIRSTYNAELKAAGMMASGVGEETAAKFREAEAKLATLNRAFISRYGRSPYGIGVNQPASAVVRPASGGSVIEYDAQGKRIK